MQHKTNKDDSEKLLKTVAILHQMLIHSQVCVVELVRQGNSAASEKITEA